jgi:hypothetical protein
MTLLQSYIYIYIYIYNLNNNLQNYYSKLQTYQIKVFSKNNNSTSKLFFLANNTYLYNKIHKKGVNYHV